MKKTALLYLSTGLLLASALNSTNALHHASLTQTLDPSIDPSSFLLYDKPAQKWEDALPVGNGRLGAMVFGKYGEEQIQLNEETLIRYLLSGVQNPENMKRFMLITIFVLLAGLLILLGVLRAWSPGKPRPFLDHNGKTLAGSISEKAFLDINGVRQGMFIKGRSIDKPVLLYLHGGMPDYFLTQRYPTGLEDDFIVVWWEQRGSGLSFQADLPQGSVTTGQLIADVLALTDYLRRRFGQEKIYLMGHSGGTFIGIQAAARAPERYHAYIGVAQISNQLRSEQLAYEYMLNRFRESGNRRMVQKLEAAPVTPTGGLPAAYIALRDPAMHRLGIGTMHNMKSVFGGILLPSWQFREYTLQEKFNLWRAKFRSGVSIVWDDVLATDLNTTLPEVNLPVYFLHGVYDYTCSYPEAKVYLQRLKAPVKGFYTFDRSAHSPLFEEPEKMGQILREDVLTGTNRLADKP